jgi:GT2 family glycosyltransferase
MLISLVVATVQRVREVEALLESLAAQDYRELEVILVDQNADDRLVYLEARFADRFCFRRLRSGVRNLSHARNLGIAVAGGAVIGFPDDDCLYPAGVLARIAGAFAADKALAVLTGPAFSPEGRPGSGRWEMRSGAIDIRNVWTSVIAFNLFVRPESLARIGGFDESFGLGARFGSGEETDLVIRVMNTGAKCYYDFDLRIIHPDKALTQVAAARAFRYGTGLGQLLRRHRVSAGTSANFFIRPAGGVVVSVLKMNLRATVYYLQTLRGRIYGFVTDPENPART